MPGLETDHTTRGQLKLFRKTLEQNERDQIPVVLSGERVGTTLITTLFVQKKSILAPTAAAFLIALTQGQLFQFAEPAGLLSKKSLRSLTNMLYFVHNLTS